MLYRKVFGPKPINKMPRFMYKFVIIIWTVALLSLIPFIYSQALDGNWIGIIINSIMILIIFPLLWRFIIKINSLMMHWKFED